MPLLESLKANFDQFCQKLTTTKYFLDYKATDLINWRYHEGSFRQLEAVMKQCDQYLSNDVKTAIKQIEGLEKHRHQWTGSFPNTTDAIDELQKKLSR